MENKYLHLSKALICGMLSTMFSPAFAQTTPCISCTVSNPLNSGLMLCYPFNGNANDDSGKGNNGTVSGATLTTDRFGNSNNAYSFNGSGNSISVPTTDVILNTYTYSLWFNPASVPAPGAMVSLLSIGNDPSDQVIGISNNYCGAACNGIGFSSYYNTTSTDGYWNGTQVNPNTWYHVALTRTNDSLIFYIDGNLVHRMKVTSATASYGNAPYEARIGERAGLYTQYFDGKIDDVRIYNRVITDQEVADLYDCSSPTGINEFAGSGNTLSVYPNPVKDVLNISIPNSDISDIKLMNALGEMAYAQKTEEATGIVSVDVSSFPHGFYMVMINDLNGAVQTQRIIIE